MKPILHLLALAAILVVSLSGCAPLLANDRPPADAISIQVVANTGLTKWLDGSVADFNATHAKLASGKTAYVRLQSVEAGQAVIDMTAADAVLPDVWIPDSPEWVDILASKGKTEYQGSCASVAASPLVIAIWRPIAESLGWPGRSLGWLDIGSLAADPSAWAYYSGGQFGPTFRVGHTHPGISASGADTLLAVVQAALSEKHAVSVAEIQQPIVRASMGAFEGGVASFSSSTDLLGRSMSERGIGYLGAGVMYESTLIEYGAGDPQMVPIYPYEGTFVATHPACIDQSKGAEQQEAARLFRDYMSGEKAQEAAVANGLRPANPAVSAAALSARIQGVDLAEPKIVLDAPGADAVFAVQQLWQSARKHVNLVMVLDTSGSMEGSKLDNVRAAAVQFVQQMGHDDYLSLITFSVDQPVVRMEHVKVGDQRTGIIAEINKLTASGATPLYDSIAQAAGLIARHRSSGATNAMMVLTDGLDTSSRSYRMDAGLVSAAAANETTVFTIAYGGDADQSMLSDLARQANGNFYPGTEANISAIYEDMSAAFGGSAGIGR